MKFHRHMYESLIKLHVKNHEAVILCVSFGVSRIFYGWAYPSLWKLWIQIRLYL